MAARGPIGLIGLIGPMGPMGEVTCLIHQSILMDKYIICDARSVVLRFLPDPYA